MKRIAKKHLTAKKNIKTRQRIKSYLENIIKAVDDIDESAEAKAFKEAIAKLTEENKTQASQLRNMEGDLDYMRAARDARAREINELRKKVKELQDKVNRYQYLDEFIQVLQGIKRPLLETPDTKCDC